MFPFESERHAGPGRVRLRRPHSEGDLSYATPDQSAPPDVAIGMPIRSEDLAGFDHRSALLLELRRRTYELAPDGGDGWMRTGRIRTTRAAATAKAGSPLPRRPARA